VELSVPALQKGFYGIKVRFHFSVPLFLFWPNSRAFRGFGWAALP